MGVRSKIKGLVAADRESRKAEKFYLGMISDINVNDFAFKRKLIQDIQKDKRLNRLQRTALLSLARSERASSAFTRRSPAKRR